MRLKLCACLAVLGALAAVATVDAAPLQPSFLKVDINGANLGGGQSTGPTAPGYQGWVLSEDAVFGSPWSSSTSAVGVSQVFPTGSGNVTATLTGVTLGSRAARNRGDAGGPLKELYGDFVFVTRPGSPTGDGFGQWYLKLELSGLVPNKIYEFTGFTRDHFNGGTDSYQRWTDKATLGGADGPGPWMNANVGPGALYQPSVGGVMCPIPAKGRMLSTGPAPSDDYTYGLSMLTSSDATGKITVYTWADPNSYSGTQTATLLNGFTLGVPEPSSIGLLAFGLAGIAGFRRRVR